MPVGLVNAVDVLGATAACHFFRDLKVQKCPEHVEHVMFLTFCAAYVLRATAACNLPTPQLPKVVWEW